MLVDPGDVGLALDAQLVLRCRFLVPAVFSPFGPALASAQAEGNPARRNTEWRGGSRRVKLAPATASSKWGGKATLPPASSSLRAQRSNPEFIRGGISGLLRCARNDGQSFLKGVLPDGTSDFLASTASHPASVTIAIRPCMGRDGAGYGFDLGQKRRNIFLKTGAGQEIRVICASGKISLRLRGAD